MLDEGKLKSIAADIDIINKVEQQNSINGNLNCINKENIEYVYKFIHLSDFQIRDRTLNLGPRKTQTIDRYLGIETMQTNYYQDHADVFYLGFILKAIRRIFVEVNDIDFVIHTGDAMHIGTLDELNAFNELIGNFLLADLSNFQNLSVKK